MNETSNQSYDKEEDSNIEVNVSTKRKKKKNSKYQNDNPKCHKMARCDKYFFVTQLNFIYLFTFDDKKHLFSYLQKLTCDFREQLY